ncbi:hypothetical protein JCM33374_g3730 [Metschnikowia sp. JCM 33374]|nr:hypothetical protein JCM33374_g3730 [Metschnikowia sp. JCM 33374]
MSTLTLAVKELFKPQSPSVPGVEAGLNTNDDISAANCPRSAPEMHKSKFTLGDFSKSAPELVSYESVAYGDTRAQDDSVSAVSWARAGVTTGLGTGGGVRNGAEKKAFVFPDPTLSSFVDLPQVISAISKLPTGLADANEATEMNSSCFPVDATPCTTSSTELVDARLSDSTTKSTSPIEQRSVSEEATVPPMRKLKSSLKLSKLTKSHSMSNISPKSVRFASRLERVKMFDGKESPSTVSIQNSPMGSPKYDFPVDDYFSIRHEFNGFFDVHDCHNSDSDSDTFTEYTKDKQYKINSHNFVSPQNIYDKRNSPVYLQSVYLTPDKKSLELIVMCQNLAFEKSLSIKFTFNDWKSSTISNSATYTKSFASVNFDQFKFTIPLTHLPSSISAQFCIMYVVNGYTFWDNNDSKNYKFSLDKYSKPSTLKDSFIFKPLAKEDSFTYKPPKFSPKSALNTGGRTLSTLDSEAPLGSRPRTTLESPHYDELVTKLLSVKDTEERPNFTRSSSSSPKPRYSQSYMSKKGTDFGGPMSPLGKKESTFTAFKADPESEISHDARSGNIKPESPLPKRCAVPENTTRPQLLHSFASAPAMLSKMSYADLLQNYCFSGADNSIQAPFTATTGSFNSSCNSSSASLSSDYMSPASTFQSLNDSFFV